MKKIETSAAPAAIGPYSQGIKIGNVVYCSGQIPVDPATGTVAGTAIAEQAEQSCKNVGAVLAAGGASYEQVVKTTCFLADMTDFPVFNSIYEKYFVRPALPKRNVLLMFSPSGYLSVPLYLQYFFVRSLPYLPALSGKIPYIMSFSCVLHLSVLLTVLVYHIYYMIPCTIPRHSCEV